MTSPSIVIKSKLFKRAVVFLITASLKGPGIWMCQPPGGARYQICPLVWSPVLITVQHVHFYCHGRGMRVLTNVFSRSALARNITVGLTVGIKEGRFHPAFKRLCPLKVVCSQVNLSNGLWMCLQGPRCRHIGEHQSRILYAFFLRVNKIALCTSSLIPKWSCAFVFTIAQD